MTMAVLKYDAALPYKIADISLADWGRKEMDVCIADFIGFFYLSSRARPRDPLKQISPLHSLRSFRSKWQGHCLFNACPEYIKGFIRRKRKTRPISFY